VARRSGEPGPAKVGRSGGLIHHQGTKSTKERQVEGLKLSTTRRGPSLGALGFCLVVWLGVGWLCGPLGPSASPVSLSPVKVPDGPSELAHVTGSWTCLSLVRLVSWW
jgi:hypothetical protein